MQLKQEGARSVLKCKIKKVKSFQNHGNWYLPPNHIKVIKNTIEEALRNARYSIDPIPYYQEMRERYDKILELEKIDSNCICGIKFSGSICYTTQKEIQTGEV